MNNSEQLEAKDRIAVFARYLQRAGCPPALAWEKVFLYAIKEQREQAGGYPDSDEMGTVRMEQAVLFMIDVLRDDAGLREYLTAK